MIPRVRILAFAFALACTVSPPQSNRPDAAPKIARSAWGVLIRYAPDDYVELTAPAREPEVFQIPLEGFSIDLDSLEEVRAAGGRACALGTHDQCLVDAAGPGTLRVWVGEASPDPAARALVADDSAALVFGEMPQAPVVVASPGPGISLSIAGVRAIPRRADLRCLIAVRGRCLLAASDDRHLRLQVFPR